MAEGVDLSAIRQRYAPRPDVGWEAPKPGTMHYDVLALIAEVERLRGELDEAQLRSIEARNPGIDMAEVHRMRSAAGG